MNKTLLKMVVTAGKNEEGMVEGTGSMTRVGRAQTMVFNGN
jgi:hypothetical protein